METRYFLILRRWSWLLILATLISGGTAYYVVNQQPPVFEANTKLLVGPGIDSPNPDINDLRAGGQLMETYAELIVSSPLLQNVIDRLQISMTPEKLSEKIDVGFNTSTQIVSITVRDKHPSFTITVANAIADAVVAISPSGSNETTKIIENHLNTQAKNLESTILQSQETVQELETSLQAYSTGKRLSADEKESKKALEQQLSAERSHLNGLLSSITALYDNLRKTTTNQVKIIETATFSSSVNSNIQLYTLVAGMAAFLLALVFIIVYEYTTDTIKSGDELTDLTGLSILATIPRQIPLPADKHMGLVVSEKPDSPMAEIFRYLGTNILPFLRINISDAKEETEITDQSMAITKPPLNTLLISSLQADDDTSDIAANLAIILSQVGIKTILVDSDFHHPRLNELFSVTIEKGLINLLSGNGRETLTRALQSVSPGLSILPTGAVQSLESSSFFELLVSGYMADLMKQIKDKAKVSIFIAPSLTLYSESMILASRVNGVLLLGQENRTNRKKAVRTLNSLRAHGVQSIGIIMKQEQPIKLWENILVMNSKLVNALHAFVAKFARKQVRIAPAFSETQSQDKNLVE